MTLSPATIQSHEDISKAKAMMDKYDVRTLPVVDERGKLLGVVGIKDFMKEGFGPMSARMTRQEKGNRTGERKSQEIEVQNIMSEPAITTEPNAKIHEAVEKMVEHNISTLVVTKNDEIKGVLTRYDLIEIIASFREKKEVYVQINGVEGGPEVYNQMHDLIQGFLEKINNVLEPLVLNVQVVSHSKGNAQGEYSVRLRLSTDHGMLYAKETDWNIMKALDSTLDSLKKRIFENKEKRLDRRRHPKYQKFKSEN